MTAAFAQNWDLAIVTEIAYKWFGPASSKWSKPVVHRYSLVGNSAVDVASSLNRNSDGTIIIILIFIFMPMPFQLEFFFTSYWLRPQYLSGLVCLFPAKAYLREIGRHSNAIIFRLYIFICLPFLPSASAFPIAFMFASLFYGQGCGFSREEHECNRPQNTKHIFYIS